MRPQVQHVRALAALALALFALGWLGDRAHTTLERHAWCDEHQRVEHQAGSPSHGEAAIDRPPHDDPTPVGPAVEALRPDGLQHEACGIVLARAGDPAGVAPARASGLDPLAEVGRSRVPPGADAAHASVPLVLLAPKLSPPAA